MNRTNRVYFPSSRVASSAAARSAGRGECKSSGSPVIGMGEGEAVGVEEVAGEQGAAFAVHGVAHDGVAQPGQVHAGLVGAAGV